MGRTTRLGRKLSNVPLELLLYFNVIRLMDGIIHLANAPPTDFFSAFLRDLCGQYLPIPNG